MPQLVKGEKNTLGWLKVYGSGKIAIPPDAFDKYNFSTANHVYLLSGSKRSGEFGLTTLILLKNHRSRIFCAHTPNL